MDGDCTFTRRWAAHHQLRIRSYREFIHWREMVSAECPSEFHIPTGMQRSDEGYSHRRTEANIDSSWEDISQLERAIRSSTCPSSLAVVSQQLRVRRRCC
jgi:hypothetical protein